LAYCVSTVAYTNTPVGTNQNNREYFNSFSIKPFEGIKNPSKKNAK
jgi:hypothetical protein